jgi:hypothetical protein
MPLNSDHLRKSHQKGHMQVDHISCYAHRFHERMSYSGEMKPCGEGLLPTRLLRFLYQRHISFLRLVTPSATLARNYFFSCMAVAMP